MASLESHRESSVSAVVSEIAKLFEQYFDVQVVAEPTIGQPQSNSQRGSQQGKDDKVEEDLAPHRLTILEKLAVLNKQSLEGLMAILEDKTRSYQAEEEGATTQQTIGNLMKALRQEVQKFQEKLTSEGKSDEKIVNGDNKDD